MKKMFLLAYWFIGILGYWVIGLLAYWVISPASPVFATCYCADPTADQCKCAAVPPADAIYSGDQDGVAVKCTTEPEANSTFEKKNPICGSAVETIPWCAYSADPNKNFWMCYGAGFTSGTTDLPLPPIDGQTQKSIPGSTGPFTFTFSDHQFTAPGGTITDPQDITINICWKGVFCCGSSVCSQDGVPPKSTGCTPQTGLGNPTVCSVPPSTPSCDQIRNDEPHQLRPNPGAPCVDKPDPAGRLSCASDFEMHHVIDDPYGWGAFSCPPGNLSGFTDKSNEKPYDVSVDVKESTVIINGQPVKTYACAYQYSRVLQDIEFNPQIDHTLLDIPIAGLASRSCQGQSPGEGCLADKQPAAALLSNYTSWYHQGVTDPSEIQSGQNNTDRSNLLASEMDEFFKLGISGYLVWQYSGPIESPLDNDQFSFFKNDPVCAVMKTKAVTLGNGQFVGVNMHSLANYDSATIEESLEYLSSECGTSVVRIWGSPDRGGPQAIKKVLDIAKNYGIKIIVAIADYSNSSGDILPGPIRSDPTNWYDHEYQTNYLPYVKDMANTLKGNPALYAYELANEAHCSGHAECVAPYTEWADQVSSAIKSIDLGAKVGIGQKASEDTTRGDSPTPGDFTTSNTSGSINITSGHYYPLNSPNEKVLVKTAKSQADGLGKPFYIGEAGIPLDQNSGTGGIPVKADWMTLLGPIRKLIPKKVLDARKNDVIDRALLPAGNPNKSYNQIVAFVKDGKAIPRSQAIEARDFDQVVRLSDMAGHRDPNPEDQPWRDIWENYMVFTSTSDLPGRVFITVGSQETAEFKQPKLVITDPKYKVAFPHNRELDEASNLLQSIFRPNDVPETTNYKETRISSDYYDTLDLATTYTTVRGKTVTGKASPQPAFDTQTCNLIAKTNSGDRLHDETSPSKDNTITGSLFVTKPVVFSGTLYSANSGTTSLPSRGESVGTIGVYIQTPPAADNVWDRLINGPASVLKAVIPPGLIEGSDIPGQSKGIGYYCGPDCRVNPTSPAAFFPHWGSVLDLFHQKLQQVLTPNK